MKNRPENLISGKENFYEIYVYYDVTSGYRDMSRKICQTAASWTLVTLVKNWTLVSVESFEMQFEEQHENARTGKKS